MSAVEQAEREIKDAQTDEAWVQDEIAKAFREWGVAFRATRQRRSLSLREAAKRAKVSPAFLSDVERGKRFPTEKMRRQLREAVR